MTDEKSSLSPTDHERFTSYRDEFPILREKIHLGNCSQSPQSLAVQKAMTEYLDNWAHVGMDWGFWMQGVERAKASFARLIGADTDEIAVVGSVSDAVNTVASCLPFRGRGKVVTTTAEFPTVGHAWLANAGRSDDLCVEFVPGDGQFGPASFEPALDEETAILSVHHVAYYNGALQDIESLAKLAHHHGAVIFVDAYQSLGTVPVNVREMGIDILASGNLKYLLGMPGIAFLYVRRELANELQPSRTGWFGRVNPFHFDATALDFAPGARRFDTGTPPVMAAFAARGGIDLLLDVGIDAIHKRVTTLSAHALRGASERGLNLASPLDPNEKGATTAIRVPDSHAVEEYLASRNIIASARGDVIRIAPHFFSREDEIDTALDAIVDCLDEK